MNEPKPCAPLTRGRHAPSSHLVDLALQVAGWSPCRSKRGSVIFLGENVVAHGHNYKPEGFACDGTAACKATCRTEAIHAAQLALLAAGWQAFGAEMLHVKSVNGQLVPSGGPSCVQCSKLALAAGVSAMWLYHEDGWRRYEAAEWHRLSLEHPRNTEAVASHLEKLQAALEAAQHREEALEAERNTAQDEAQENWQSVKQWKAQYQRICEVAAENLARAETAEATLEAAQHRIRLLVDECARLEGLLKDAHTDREAAARLIAQWREREAYLCGEQSAAEDDRVKAQLGHRIDIYHRCADDLARVLGEQP